MRQDQTLSKNLRDDRGGQLQDVLPDRGIAAGGCGDADVVEGRRKDIGVERLPGSAAGEQPPAGVVGCGVHIVPAVDPAEQEFHERFGDGGRRLAEPEEGLLLGAGDVVQREADDAAERLGVKQDDALCDSGPQRRLGSVRRRE
ncbi:hypothetical protein [Streptomyces monomycini]|uniref:hypothetical protein n=1 Tax=Streptomyces monomycini TaxID=371720 RepID=UPI0004ABBC81|nr:hypothetical protein [Streptomyces monomycini]